VHVDELSARKVLTVGELTHQITELVEEAFPFVWVKGEVSGLAIPRSGHVYFTLKDDTSQIRVVVFKGQARTLGISPSPEKTTGEGDGGPALPFDGTPAADSGNRLLKDGDHVLVMGRVSVYAPRGEYQLIADYVEPVGIGMMAKALEELKRRLSDKGYFDAARKRPLPFLPARIAVVTSPTGAALFDMLKVIFARMPASRVVVVPTRVQGDGAELEIARAIDLINREARSDVIIVGRGGGSIEDLWAFNTEVVADAVFRSKIPVISAVGHEIDFTISDLVADVRAPTPTAAAELVAPRLDDILMTLDLHTRRLTSRMRYLISEKKGRLGSLGRRVRNPKQDLDRFRLGFTIARTRLSSGMVRVTGARKNRFLTLTGAIERLSPLSVLSRGYAVVRRADDGRVIRSGSDVEVGERATIRLSRDVLSARIDKKETLPNA
jgi:exodeoxyribonuclease VII large subunit